jgi:hypothetical protein
VRENRIEALRIREAEDRTETAESA